MESVGSSEAQPNLPQHLERVAEENESTITKHGKAEALQVIAQWKAFNKGNILGKAIAIRDLIQKGRHF